MIRCISNINILKRAGLVLALFSLLSLQVLHAQNDTVATTIEHNPNKALLLSAVLPGAGQVYNRQAWKVPIVYAALGGGAYFIYFNHKQMKTYKDEYLYRVGHDGAVNSADLANTPTSNVYNLYENYNKTFQLSIIVTAALYGLNLLDAYVFGHLFDFQITDDLTLNVIPELIPCFVSGSALKTNIVFFPTASIRLRF